MTTRLLVAAIQKRILDRTDIKADPDQKLGEMDLETDQGTLSVVICSLGSCISLIDFDTEIETWAEPGKGWAGRMTNAFIEEWRR